MKIEWQYLENKTNALTTSRTWRLKVPAGWIVRSWFVPHPQDWKERQDPESGLFIPDPNHEWEDGWEEKREKEQKMKQEIMENMERSRIASQLGRPSISEHWEKENKE